MARKIRPTKTSQRKSSSVAKEQDKEKLAAINIKIQKQIIDEYNNQLIGNNNRLGSINLKEEYFNNIQIQDGIVVQMFMEDIVKTLHVWEGTDEVANMMSSLRQIDARQRVTDKPNWVTAPFPLISKAIVMAVSPTAKLEYYKQREELAKYDQDAANEIIIPEVGDTVYMKTFIMKDRRFYPDKKAKVQDFMKNQFEYNINNFDWLFHVGKYEIESIVKRGSEDLMLDRPVSLEDRIEYVKKTEIDEKS